MDITGRMTLSEFQQMIGNTLRSNPMLSGAWVMAELSDVRLSGGHCYMELIEKDERGATRAKLRAMIWSNTLLPLRRKFYQETGSDIITGLKVMVRGSANHHPVYGLSFIISDIDPSYTLGDLERLRREIIERLRREGKLDLNHQLPFPVAPQRVAVISAEGAAGYGDFINQIDNNPDGFKFYHHLFPAVMQGTRTSESVRAALGLVEETVSMWDCVLIIRGGGSTSDLNGFDDYALAERVATFPLPVVMGIGHERDRTVLDDIACVRCKTPTAVAAFLIDTTRSFYAGICDRVKRIAQYSDDALRGEQQRLAAAEALLPTRAKNCLLRAGKRLDEAAHAVERGVNRRLEHENLAIARLSHRIEMAAARRTDMAENALRLLRARLETDLKNVTVKPAMRLKNAEAMLRVLSPANTLSRGYSITRVNGRAVRDASALCPGDVISTTLASGTLESTVTATSGTNDSLSAN